MDKDQYHMQILKTLYLYEILLPWDLFIVKGSVLKQMIISSSSQDISNLVSNNLVLLLPTPRLLVIYTLGHSSLFVVTL